MLRTRPFPRASLGLAALLIQTLISAWFPARAAEASTAPAQGATPETKPLVLVVVGAPGEEMFGSNFVHQAERWQNLAERAGARATLIGLTPTEGTPEPPSDLDRLRAVIDAEPATTPAELWLILIGHGTFDGREARFNLRGPDLGATDLAAWLQRFQRPLAILNTASASAPFLRPLAGPNRVVISATRSGFEQNFTRFGQHLADAIGDTGGDLDQDGQTSLLEAFLSASFRVAEFYKTEGRMATEHALIDDNGDGLGTPADWFRGLRAVKKAKDGALLDGARAHQFHLLRSPWESQLSPEVRARRDTLEQDLAALRENRPAQPDDAWYARIEPLLLDLARLYRSNAPAPPR